MKAYNLKVIEEEKKIKEKYVVIGDYKVDLENTLDTLGMLKDTDGIFEIVCIPDYDLGKLLVELGIASHRGIGDKYSVKDEAKRRELLDEIYKHL